MKILNLYAGIGGNRKLWNDKHEVTAVEIDKEIAKKYQQHFPKDKIVVSDAHKYLLKHFKEFDFIWSSPPCQSHSRTNYFLKTKKVRYPDFKLYEEIVLLDTHFKGRWVVENTIPYYNALIKPQVIGRHCLWANFKIPSIKLPKDDIGKMCGKNQKAHNKPLEERNAVDSKLGLHVLECSIKKKQWTVGDFTPSGSLNRNLTTPLRSVQTIATQSLR